MDGFYRIISKARHKLIAHNDGKSLIKAGALGSFKEGIDKEYFDNLKKFANLASRKYLLTPFVYNDLSVTDVYELLEVLRNQDL